MKKILAFGTFDILHLGHEYYLKESKKFGEKLYVVVALDETVKKVKGELPKNNENERLKKIQELDYVDKAIHGSKDDKLKVIEDIKPDIICIGYDQNSFTKDLQEKLMERGLNPLIIKFSKAHKPEIYKSSKLKS